MSRSRGAPPSPERADIADRLLGEIARGGPIPLDRFMAAANDFYYATHDPFGPGGDFVTGPEVSQMFGELVGLALADLWQRAGGPAANYVELGPGRGTLAADALRAMRTTGLDPAVHLVETSPRLRAVQAERLPQATWHDGIDSLPAGGALLVVANEFFDALPIRQLIRTVTGWRERCVTVEGGGFAFVPGADSVEREVPATLLSADPGSVVELRPAADAIVQALAARLGAQGGALLAIDYGHDGRRHGDTLQAVRAHAYANALAHPGASDLTAHVDFGALARAAAGGDVQVHGPIEQGQWLAALGLAGRAAVLARAAPDQTEALAAAYRRLADPEEMGSVFKVMAIVAHTWPGPAAFG